MTRSRIVLLAAGVALLLALPSLRLGFVPNDYFFLALIEGWYPSATGQPLNLYASFFDLPGFPWWISPESRAAFWRPLTSALLWLDHALFDRSALFYHLHSLVWLAGLVAVCGLLLRRLPRGLAALSLLVLVFDESQITTGAWISARHALVSVVPGLLGLEAHLRWRERGGWPWLTASLLGFAVGLLGGETGVAVLALALAHALFAESRVPIRRRLLAALPMTVLAVAYLVGYRAMGYGVSGLSYYLDPALGPLLFFSELIGRLTALLGALVTGLPAVAWAYPEARPWQIGITLAALVPWTALLWRWWAQTEAETRAMLRWLLPGAAAAMLPAALPLPDERTLLVPSIAFAVVHALMLRAAWRRWRGKHGPLGGDRGGEHGADGRRLRRLAAGGLILVLGLVHFAMPVARRVLEHVTISETLASFERIAAGLPLERRGERQLIAVTGPPWGTLHYFPQFLDLQGPPVATCWYQLSGSPNPMKLSRTAPQTLELEFLEGRMFDSVAADLLRPVDDPTDVGRLWDTPLFQAEVLAADDRGPTRLAFRFEQPIDVPDVVFLVWEEERFRPLELPAVGESVNLASPAGPRLETIVEDET